MRHLRSRQYYRGFSLVEALTAGLILSIGVMGIVKLWTFSFQMTTSTDERTIGMNLARQTVERAKRVGYYYLAETTSTTYYDADQKSMPLPSANTKYRVVTQVSTSPSWPNNNKCFRMVFVTVYRVSNGEVLAQTRTILVRGGV